MSSDLFSYWQGPVTWFERMCVASMVEQGHRLTVYTYDDIDALRGAGLPARIEDARKILRHDKFSEKFQIADPSHFTDHFRFEGLAQGAGTWIDLDVLMLKPLPDTPHLFGRENVNLVGSALLRLPPDSPFLTDAVAFYRRRPFYPVIPTWPLKRRLRRSISHFRRLLLGQRIKTVLGPDVVTWLTAKHGIDHLAKPQEVFFPVVVTQSRRFVVPGDLLDDVITPQTLAVHVFGKAQGLSVPPADSWLGVQRRRFESKIRDSEVEAGAIYVPANQNTSLAPASHASSF